MSVVDKLKIEIKKRKISIVCLSKLTNIKYELLRRVFAGKRKLTADEFVKILDVANIDFNEVK